MRGYLGASNKPKLHQKRKKKIIKLKITIKEIALLVEATIRRGFSEYVQIIFKMFLFFSKLKFYFLYGPGGRLDPDLGEADVRGQTGYSASVRAILRQQQELQCSQLQVALVPVLPLRYWPA